MDERFRKASSSQSLRPVRPCVVGILTKTGSHYEFPDIDKGEIHKVLSSQVYSAGNLTLVNISGACLTLPIRIIDTIAIDGEVTWRAPSSTP